MKTIDKTIHRKLEINTVTKVEDSNLYSYIPFFEL
jgi:hypothetical protein